MTDETLHVRFDSCRPEFLHDSIVDVHWQDDSADDDATAMRKYEAAKQERYRRHALLNRRNVSEGDE